MDAVLLAGIAREWANELTGARIERALSPDAHRLDLVLRVRGRDRRLTFFLRPGDARCHPALDAPANPPAPTGFCMFLRRHLVGGRVEAVDVPAAERRLIIALASENEIGERERRHLHFEAFGPRPNLILVDGRGRVMDAFRRVSAAGEGARAILPGLAFEPPPTGTKLDPFALGPPGLVEILLAAAPSDRLADALVRRVRGLSPMWARELLALAGLDADAAGRDGADAHSALLRASFVVLELLAGAVPAPCLVRAPDGRPLAASPQPPRQFGPAARIVPLDTLGEAVARLFLEQEGTARLEQRRSTLLRTLERRRARLAHKLSRQDEEWREADRDLALRHAGDLLLANLHSIAPGARRVRLDDWDRLDDEGRATPVELALDPERTASENAERMFARYRKARRRHDALAGEMERARRELDYIDNVADALRRAEESEVLDALAEEVEQAGVLGPPPGARPHAHGRPQAQRRAPSAVAARRTGTAVAAPLRPLAYRTPGGFLVEVGRTGPENERLALHHAAADDLWFHVAHGPGGHALLRLASGPAGRVPDERDIAAAALIAAYHSAARAGSHVEVDRCRAGRLRKPPGGRPGLLLYERDGSLSVTPDAAVVAAMRVDDATHPGRAPSSRDPSTA